MTAKWDHNRLRRLRVLRGLTVEQVAERAYERAYGSIERGGIVPSVRALEHIAHVLRVPVADLYDPDDPDDPVVRYDRAIQKMVDGMPPLTQGQIAQLRVLLRPEPGHKCLAAWRKDDVPHHCKYADPAHRTVHRCECGDTPRTGQTT